MTAPRLQSIAMRKARRQILVADMAIHDRLSITEIARKVDRPQGRQYTPDRRVRP